ncbi:MAG: hypothetical protein M3Q10_02500 [Chloroflexota bacterium]|nr:hypothetical protein [Chloroflexota bacterium]
MRKDRSRTRAAVSSTSPTQSRSPLRIAIATAAQVSGGEVSLSEDIRLLKPALLYADAVTLYSPGAVMLTAASNLTRLDAAGRMSFLRQIYPILEPDRAPVLLALLDGYRRLEKQKRGRSQEELLAYLQLRPRLEKLKVEIDRVWADDLVPKVEQLLKSAGADQLLLAVSQGLLQVDPLLEGDQGFDKDAVIEAFVARVAQVLSERGTYPLFDGQTGTLVRHGIAEGLFRTAPLSRERGKQVAVASDLMARLPAFPKATVAEILDIRTELEAPLVRFRAAMIELGKLVEAAAFEEGFADQVDELFRVKVEPALLEIEEQVQANSYLRALIGEIVGDSRTLLTGILGVGIAHAADVPQLVAAGAAAGQATAKAAWEKRARGRKLSEHELYFLYRTEQLLAGRT